MMAAPQFSSGRILGNVQSSEIWAASGITASQTNPGVLWTFNDVGDSRVFATDVKGRHLGTFTTGATVSDYEDIATGPGPTAGTRYLYVADIGDNSVTRATIKVVRLPEPSVTATQSPVTATATGAQTLTFRYPDGAHNAETLIVDPSNGDLYIVTKSDARNRIYRAAFPQSTATTTTLQYMGEMTWGGAVGGAISPDGSELLVKNLNTVYYYPRAAGTSITAALQATPTTLPYTPQQLGEGITFDADGWGYITNSEGNSQPLYFYERVAAPTTTTGSFRFAVIGDYGSDGPNEDKVADLVKTWDPSFVITTGDNNYSVGAASTIDPNIGKHYSQFIGSYQGAYGPGASQNRFFPSLGNHDWGTPGAQPYLNYFSLPGNERYYDYVKGPVHFYAIDSDPNEPSGRSATSAQAQWLQSALAASTSTFNIVYMHHSPYSSSSTHGPDPVMQWPFKQWGADIVVTGHDHTYERLLVDGLTYIVNGIGGRSLYGFGTTAPGSQVRYNANYGAQLVTVDASAMKFDLYSIDGVLRDTFTIPATQQPPPPPPAGTLIPAGATWKYLDNGTMPASNWTTTAYTDTAWKSGRAQLGYGDGDEATIVSYGPNASSKYVTTYFRHAFNVADTTQLGNLTLRLKRDDGAIVYVNGQEVARSNMPAGAVTSTTLASTAVGDAAEATFYSFTVDKSRLINGANVVAVEVHQANRTSTDVSFDLELTSSAPTTPPAEVSFVATGRGWRILDSGGDPGTAWRASSFNDSTWKVGRTQAGYGEGDEATVVSYGSNANNKRVSTYFRTDFQVSDPTQLSALTLDLLRDDGAVVYLNGVEIVRSNMPTGTIGFNTLAATNVAAEDERRFFRYSVPTSRLVAGRNVLAVELHQANVTSYDTSFDLRLMGTMRSTLTASGLSDGNGEAIAAASSSSNSPQQQAEMTTGESPDVPVIDPARTDGKSSSADSADWRRLWLNELAARRHAARQAVNAVMETWG